MGWNYRDELGYAPAFADAAHGSAVGLRRLPGFSQSPTLAEAADLLEQAAGALQGRRKAPSFHGVQALIRELLNLASGSNGHDRAAIDYARHLLVRLLNDVHALDDVVCVEVDS